MGTSGMRYSLVSREVIADSIETNAGAQYYDGIISIAGCDKNMPGVIMGMSRLNRPSLMIYGGTIAAGKYKNESFGFHFHTLNIIIVNINITMLLNDEHSKSFS